MITLRETESGIYVELHRDAMSLDLAEKLRDELTTIIEKYKSKDKEIREGKNPWYNDQWLEEY